MLNLLALALATLSQQPRVPERPAAPPAGEAIQGDFHILEPGPKQQNMIYASVGTLPRFLAFGCESGDGSLSVLLSLNANVGYSMPGVIAGGTRVRYSFDGGPEQSKRWAGVGDTVIARAAPSRPLEFVRALRGTTSVRLRVEVEGGREVDVTYRYSDPSAIVDEVARRCGVTLEEPARR